MVRLSLESVCLVKARPSAVLRGAKELTCDSVSTSHSDTSTFLSPTTFPQLECLAIYFDDGPVDCIVSPNLFQQLVCVVSIDAGLEEEQHLSKLPSTCIPFANTECKNISSAEDALHFACYRLRHRFRLSSPTPFRLLSRAIADCESQRLRLSRLSLPPTLLTLAEHEVAEALDTLVTVASQRGIAVVVEEGENKLGGSFLPLSTIEYARKLRAEQEKAERDAKGGRQ